ncbi:MAG: hypothetical protein Kow00121_29680 [Elainellaceae cyanobacterium]
MALGFIVANGALAAGLYMVLQENPTFAELPGWLAATLAGIGYLTIIRLKIITLQIGETQAPLGLELLYEAAKGSVYKRINRIAKEARYEETVNLAKAFELEDLIRRANLSIAQDALLNPDEKEEAQDWVQSVLSDVQLDNLEKREILADFILSERINRV